MRSSLPLEIQSYFILISAFICMIWGIWISRPTALCLAPGLGPGPQFVFTGPGPQFVFTGLAPNLYLPGLTPNLYLSALAPNFYLPTLALNFYLPALVSPEHGLAYTDLVPLICIYWPWPTNFITVL